MSNAERLAIMLLARDEAEVSKPIPEYLIEWATNIIKKGKEEKHSGDCTNESHSCLRCTADRALAHAHQILDSLHL